MRFRQMNSLISIDVYNNSISDPVPYVTLVNVLASITTEELSALVVVCLVTVDCSTVEQHVLDRVIPLTDHLIWCLACLQFEKSICRCCLC
jgi:hypothetical protein